MGKYPQPSKKDHHLGTRCLKTRASESISEVNYNIYHDCNGKSETAAGSPSGYSGQRVMRRHHRSLSGSKQWAAGSESSQSQAGMEQFPEWLQWAMSPKQRTAWWVRDLDGASRLMRRDRER